MDPAQHEEFPDHGTAAGYAAGCRSRGGCPHHQSKTFLTCVEADTARRADFAIARLPLHEPVRRQAPSRERRLGHVKAAVDTTRQVDRRSPSAGSTRIDAPNRDIEHGTTTGYLKGCRRHEGCPRGSNGSSCNETRNRLRRAWARSKGVEPKPSPVDAAPAAAHIAELQRSGMSLRDRKSVV